MLDLFRRFYWKHWGTENLYRDFDAMTLPQLNLLEAEIHRDGRLTPYLETLFATWRVKKNVEAALEAAKERMEASR